MRGRPIGRPSGLRGPHSGPIGVSARLKSRVALSRRSANDSYEKMGKQREWTMLVRTLAGFRVMIRTIFGGTKPGVDHEQLTCSF